MRCATLQTCSRWLGDDAKALALRHNNYEGDNDVADAVRNRVV